MILRIICFILLSSFICAEETARVSERNQLILNIIKRHDNEIDPKNGLVWGTHNSPKGYHSNFDRGTRVHPTRTAMERAVFLLASPKSEHWDEGNRTLAKVLDLQDTNPQSKTFGVWSWYAEEPIQQMAHVDYNWADFQGALLVIILHDFAHRLNSSNRTRAAKSLEYCCRAIIRRNVGAAYTNIAITGATVTASAGEILRNAEFLDFGRRRILRSLANFRESGAFGEYNSPAYLPVVIEELERMLYLVADMDCRNAAKELLSGAWEMIAIRYHVPTGELAGPHSRSYSDRMTTKLRNMITARCNNTTKQNKLAQNAAEAAALVPLRNIDSKLQNYFTVLPETPREVKNLFVKNRTAFEVTGTTWLDTKSTIGTASYHTFWEQAHGLIGYWVIDKNNESNGKNNIRNNNLPVKKSNNETVAVFRLRFKHNGNDFASAWGRHCQNGNKILTAVGLLTNQGSMHPSMDKPANSIFRAKSFELEYHLDGFGASVRQVRDGCYELSAGSVRVLIHTTPESRFDGKPLTWETESNLTSATLRGVCYRGKEREFNFETIQDTRIILGLELLQDGRSNESDTRIKIEQTSFKTKRDGNFYSIIWQPLNPKKPLLAPIKPTQK
ncbi:MAG: hypothetical protein LBT09_13785 [Planctomycetaceae bacterium]|jgi:hypothetical protein|nr:hypothetical protein [Planctomycetaceae bacterium]